MMHCLPRGAGGDKPRLAVRQSLSYTRFSRFPQACLVRESHRQGTAHKEPPAEVRNWLGHANISTASVYSHMTADEEARAISGGRSL